MADLTLPAHFVAIDEEGYPLNGETRITDESVGRHLFETLSFAANGSIVAKFGEAPVLIEAFDEPLIAKRVDRDGDRLEALFPYGHVENFRPETLRLDEWDRFHGLTERGIPFVMSRPAQAAFFDLLDEFDDESITFAEETYDVPPLHDSSAIVAEKDWTAIYENEGTPRWDLGEAAPALKDMLPRLRLPKSRILVPGCGEGHDAAFFANEGHVVTAVDFSPEAIRRATERYGHMKNLKFVQADLFKFGAEHEAAYDVIFDQACFNAIDPTLRKKLVQLWKRWLAPGGQLMGSFFVMHKPAGPPFGASEWELRERLRSSFRFIFWGRWKASLPRRQGKELFVYPIKL